MHLVLHLLVKNASSRGNETKEWRRWIQRARRQLRMGLHADKVWMTLQLRHLHAVSLLILANKREACTRAARTRLDCLHNFRIHFVTMTVALPDNRLAAIQPADLAP